jgi:hypothetical protein
MPNKKSKKITGEEIMAKMHEGFDEVASLVKSAKEKYAQADEKTKKKVIAGVVGAAAILAGVIGAKAFKKKKKD